MNTAAKLAIGLFLVGGTVLLVVAGEKKAKAAELDDQPNPGPNILPPVPTTPSGPGPGGGVVLVPPAAQAPPGDAPHPYAMPAIVPQQTASQNGAGGFSTPGVSIPLPGGGHLDVPPMGFPAVTTPVQPAPAATPTSAPAAPPLVFPDPLGGLTPAVRQAPQPVATAPADTVAVVKQMLGEEGNGTNWRKVSPLLKVWQSSRGLTADGEFGTGSALKMADEIGTLPIIRDWPRGSTLQGHWLSDYQAALLAKANAAPEPRATHLRAAAQREQGQGFGTPPKPILTQISFDPND
jgi:hypothetical protein